MKVKLKNIMAGPEGAFSAGSVVDVPEAEGRYLVESGQADAVGPVGPIKRGTPIETAEKIPTGEKTDGGQAGDDSGSDDGADDAEDGKGPSKSHGKHKRR